MGRTNYSVVSLAPLANWLTKKMLILRMFTKKHDRFPSPILGSIYQLKYSVDMNGLMTSKLAESRIIRTALGLRLSELLNLTLKATPNLTSKQTPNPRPNASAKPYSQGCLRVKHIIPEISWNTTRYLTNLG